LAPYRVATFSSIKSHEFFKLTCEFLWIELCSHFIENRDGLILVFDNLKTLFFRSNNIWKMTFSFRKTNERCGHAGMENFLELREVEVTVVVFVD